MAQFRIEDVLRAMAAMNVAGQGSSAGSNESMQYLDRFKNSVEAWNICDVILSTPGLDPAAYFNAANILKNKLSKNFVELPISGQGALINRLFEHLCHRFAAGPKNVQTQLILSIYEFVVKSRSWPASGPIEFTISLLSPFPLLLLRTLELFGEESTRSSPQEKSIFTSASFAVMQQLLAFYDASRPAPASDQEKQLAFKCICAWLKQFEPPHGTSLPSALTFIVSTIPVYAALAVDDLFESAGSLLSEIAYHCRDRAADPEFAPLVSFLTSSIPIVAERLSPAIAQEDDDAVKVFALMLNDIGLVVLPQMAASPSEATTFFGDLMLRLVSYCESDPENYGATMNNCSLFWEALSQAHHLQVAAPAGQAALKSAPSAHVAQLFSSLIPVIVQRIQWPAASDSWRHGSDEEYNFSRFRDIEVAYMLDDSTCVLGGDGALGIIWPSLAQVLAAPAAHPWRQVEALLFVATCLVHRTENTFQPFLFAVLQNLQHIASTNSKCVSVLLGLFRTDFVIERLTKPDFASHAPACASAIFSFIQSTLAAEPQQFQFHATQALRNLAFHCPILLAPQIELLAIQAASNSDRSLKFISSAARKNFMDALGFIVSALPIEQAVQAQLHICWPALSDLQRMLAEPGELDDNAVKVRGRQRCVDTAVRLTSFYEALQAQVQKHESKDNFHRQIFGSTHAHVWPVLRDILWRCARDDFVTEDMTKVLKHWLRSCGAAAAPILPELCELLTQVNSARFVDESKCSFDWLLFVSKLFFPHALLQCIRRAGPTGSVFVWVASTVIGDFAKLPEHSAVVDQLQQAIASTVYEQLAAGLPAMEQHADMTLEILDLVSRALRRFPHLPQTPTFQVSLQFALVRTPSLQPILLLNMIFRSLFRCPSHPAMSASWTARSTF
jgi:transportin-3